MAEAFDEAFPHYLIMGMTPEQYWEDDCRLVVGYREAYRIKQDNENRYAWLQGLYIYEALCDVAPVLHAFAKSGTKVRPYPDKPHEFEKPKKKLTKTAAVKAENEKKMDATAAFMNMIAGQFNKQFQKKRESAERE